MSRLTRAQMQQRTRATVLAAARDEFIERGFRNAKIDAIAERAGLTRGGVYSNFPGKRALYFAVLAEDAERAPQPAHPESASTVSEALAAFARAWIARLPLATDPPHGPTRLGADLLPEVLADEQTRRPFAQLMKLNAILLGLALEQLPSPKTTNRLIGVAEAVLTTLHGASQLAAAAPGFLEPFTIVRACEQLAALDLPDAWPPAHLPHITPARPTDEPWSPPPALDAIRGTPAHLTDDGVVAILGLHRLAAAEEAVRAAPPAANVTAVLVTGAPDELAPLARLTIADLRACLRRAFLPSAWPRLQIVFDEHAIIHSAAGMPAISDATETAVHIRAGRIIARAEGYGACHAAASINHPTPTSEHGRLSRPATSPTSTCSGTL
ncbi:TetR/AcrR family transcriptional regulator [Frankia sp. CiP3]|uniref:TetR/AcrR family transcriptional regulator n=1 Tax=Frankia sp. CiP3 TaxID=2880971 RepID=UPI001EF6CE01|nr:TetR/AcrR family transcriptional regulator [Frankia sp. CiP3]